jgi:hypothetical protein
MKLNETTPHTQLATSNAFSGSLRHTPLNATKNQRRRKMEANEIAVRLYENKKFGSTYGKGAYHSAVFNGSADVLGTGTKYLLDYYPFEKFEHMARTDEQMDVLRQIGKVIADHTLFSWVVQYNPATKEKTPAYGVSTINLKDNTVRLVVAKDSESDGQNWELTAKLCRPVPGKNSPTLLATNADNLGGR